jgi:hypothetical protein
VEIKSGELAEKLYLHLDAISDEDDVGGPYSHDATAELFHGPGFVIPEIPYGTILSLFTMLAAVALIQKRPMNSY